MPVYLHRLVNMFGISPDETRPLLAHLGLWPYGNYLADQAKTSDAVLLLIYQQLRERMDRGKLLSMLCTLQQEFASITQNSLGNPGPVLALCISDWKHAWVSWDPDAIVEIDSSRRWQNIGKLDSITAVSVNLRSLYYEMLSQRVFTEEADEPSPGQEAVAAG